MIGLTLQIILLAALASTAGLGVVGWMMGVAYGLIASILLTVSAYRAGVTAYGPADWVTQTRATLVGCVTALTADSPHGGTPVRLLVGIATVALVFDAIDGQVARRTGTVSGFGARFDMEVDAFLILVLCVYVQRSAGAWVLAIGAMRYAYVAMGRVLPWLRGTLPYRYWRKVVAAVQGIVLVIASAGVLPTVLTVAALAGALALLVESFGRDVVWLWRRRVAEPTRQLTASVAGSPGEG